MSSQMTLTENAPLILDSTCSTLKIWPRFASLRMDICREVLPDVCASATHLPFRDGVFSAIYCDPPHRVGVTQEPKIFGKDKDYPRFGYWKSRKEWLHFLGLINQEFFRCLKTNGLFHLKITDGAVSSSTIGMRDVALLTNFEEEHIKRSASKGYFATLNKKKYGI